MKPTTAAEHSEIADTAILLGIVALASTVVILLPLEAISGLLISIMFWSWKYEKE